MSQASEPHAANISTESRLAPAKRPVTLARALIWSAVVLFTLGLLAVILTFISLAFDLKLTVALYYLSMLAPAGMILGIIGALASGRRARA